MENTSRLRTYVDSNNTGSRVTFQKGEKVEAFWSTDGQKYPGTIVHVYSNDNYEVLFNDGVKSRKKASQIFKLKGRQGRPWPKNVLPSPRVNLNPTVKPLPALIPVKVAIPKPRTGSTIPNPPPLISSSSSSSRNSNESDSPSSSRTGSPYNFSLSEETIKPTLNIVHKPSTNIHHNNINSRITSKRTVTTTVQVPPEDRPENSLCIDDSIGDATAGNSTKKGFVYVQQPHYSVFDLPSTDLGKRRRRVHNYSMLARGPSLKGGLSANIGGIDDLADGGETTSRSTSPVSPRSPTVACNSTVSTSFPSSSDETKPLATTTRTFTRPRRRFLTSPTGKTSSRTSVVPNAKFACVRKEPSEVNSESDTTNNGGKACPLNMAIFESTPIKSSRIISKNRNAETEKGVQDIKTDSKSKVSTNSSETKHTDSTNSITETSLRLQVETSPLISSVSNQQPSESDDVPSKRLRKPSFKRFSAEEGYVDIFSAKRNNRTNPPTHSRRQRQRHPSNCAQVGDDTSPKAQRPRLKDHTPPLISSKKPRKLGPSRLLINDTEQVNSTSMRVSPCPDSENLLQKVSDCDQLKSNVSLDDSRETISRNARNHKFTNDSDDNASSEEEELLDVGEYTIIQKTPTPNSTRSIASKKSKDQLLRSKKSNSPHIVSPLKTISPVMSNDESLQPHLATEEVEKLPPFPELPSSKNSDGCVKKRILRRTGRGRRWQLPVRHKPSAEQHKQVPSVVLDRLSIPEVQILVKKCDSIIPSQTYAIQKTDSSNIKTTASEDLDLLISEQHDVTVAPPHQVKNMTSSESSWKTRKKRWGPRQRAGRRLPGRSGIRVNDSLTMQLIKRSRLQRRFEKRGRPKVALLTGITKKKLKKIQESVKRRKLRINKIIACTKFKDVRVDIINCICGRTDEFGLMVQCEVCLCWQHGICFNILDGSTLPKFYVCQSCASPKRVRPSHATEGVRQETYKKGVLPSYAFAPKPSVRKQRIIKKCSDLAKVINSIDDSIRQNKMKELIALAEPDHTKLYQWSTQRTHPKDLIQKWYFNKYFKSVVRRLIHRHKCKPNYLEKLSSIVTFRDKLKKYAQAFEEARLAISRKIGTRGLILIEKLSEQQYKIDKINKAKARFHPNLPNPPIALDSPLLPEKSSKLSPALENFHDEKLPHNNLSEKRHLISKKPTLEKTLFKYGQICCDIDSESYDSDDPDNSDDSSCEENNSDTDTPDSAILEDWTETVSKRQNPIDIFKHGDDDLLNSEQTLHLQEKYKKSSVPSLNDILEDEWVDVKRTGAADVDLIKLMLEKNTKVDLSEEFISGDVESEGDLSGVTTVSVEDSEGGEDYWYNPITELNPKYDSMRRVLLRDVLLEDDRKVDTVWKPTEDDVIGQDWVTDFHLNSEFDLEQDTESEESDTSSSEFEFKVDNMKDLTSESDTSDEELEINEFQESNIEDDTNPKLRNWQKAVMELENDDNLITTDEEDPDWTVEGAVEEESFSEEESDSSESESESHHSEERKQQYKDEVSDQESLSNKNNNMSEKTTGITKGVILVTSDPNAKPGDITNVCVNVGETVRNIGHGLVISGAKGQNFIKMIDLESNMSEHSKLYLSESDGQLRDAESLKINPSQVDKIPLCKSCLDSLGSMWNWNQLHATKGIKVFYDDTLQTLIDEIKRYRTLGILSTKCNIQLAIRNKTSTKITGGIIKQPFKTYEPRKLTEICREMLSLTRNPRGTNILVQSKTDSSSSYVAPRSVPPTSAEEVSILSLLSLSTGQFNGENVSELSIESLRKLTDRLQHNGPLSEDLAKAVGQPLANGKVALQKYHTSSQQHSVVTPITGRPTVPSSSPNPSSEKLCVRCSLKDERSSKTLALLTTTNSDLTESVTEEEFAEMHVHILKALENVRGATHAVKKVIFKNISKMAERKKAERTARALGIKITSNSLQRKLALVRPEEYLSQLKSEYVDALMPYATYFISRFTKKDELSLAKRSWVNDMLQNYNKAKKSLKEMYGVKNEGGRVTNEDKFYTSLDNLRKSFDIVLTKKDIKLRRQTQSLNSSDIQLAQSSHEGTSIQSDSKTSIENSKSADHVSLVNGDIDEEIYSPNDDASSSSTSASQFNVPPNKIDSNQIHELELLARLASYPIQVEDVNALLGITSEINSKSNSQTNNSSEEQTNNISVANCGVIQIPKKDQSITSTESQNDKIPVTPETELSHLTNGISGEVEDMEVDDLRLLEENFALKSSDNLVIGGDLDLINTIGNLGTTGDLKGTEDSELLLNVFEDPIFSEPSEEPKPCCSKSLGLPQPSQLQKIIVGPVLTKLTPEMCRGHLLEDIRAHQQIIDGQLDRAEAEIMELERRRGNGLREKDDEKLFEMLCANMQILIDNMDVLNHLTNCNIGKDNISIEKEGEEDAVHQDASYGLKRENETDEEEDDGDSVDTNSNSCEDFDQADTVVGTSTTSDMDEDLLDLEEL